MATEIREAPTNTDSDRQMTDTETENHRQWKDDIRTDADTLEDQSEKANEDMRFIYTSGGMWDDFLVSEFNDRIKLQFNITTPYKNRFIGEYNLNRIGVDYKPDSDATSDEDAELLTGIRNADFQQFAGKMAQDNAVDEVATCGYGAYKVATQFEDDEDPENDNQRIIYRSIHEAYASIYWDSSSKLINKSDARWCTELIEFTGSAFEKAYPGASKVSAYHPVNRDNSSTATRTTIEERIFVATRYEVVRKKVAAFVYGDLSTGKPESYFNEDHEKVKDELRKDPTKEFLRERKVIRQSIEKTVFSGDTILEKTRKIPGKWIPIIAMYGWRGYVDGVEWYKGLVRDMMDPQRLFNMQVSQLSENAASTGQEIPILDPDQIQNESMRANWADRNNAAFLELESLRDNDGKIVKSGPVGYLKPGQLDQSTVALMQLVTEYVQQTTGGAPQDTLDPKTSGKAINALLKRENLNTQDIMDNIANAIQWEGTVYQAIAQDVYTTDRLMRTLNKDGTEGKKRINTSVLDEESGELVEANVMTGKKFRAHSEVGPQYDTAREQTVEELKGMLDALAQTEAGAKYTPPVIAMILQNITGPGLEPLKVVVRRDMILQGLVKPETDEEKQFLAQASQPKEDPNAQLLKAAATQAESEGRERDSKSIVNIADAKKKAAETQEILAGIEMDQASTVSDIRTKQAKTLADIRAQVFKDAQQLPLNQSQIN